MSHHDLGHLHLFKGWLASMLKFPPAAVWPLVFHEIESRLYGVERECDADRRGLDLCVAAGYDGRRCLSLLDVLEEICLDHGDLDMVFGPDHESDEELSDEASWKTKLRIWCFQRQRGYLPVRDRRQMLLHHLDSHPRRAGS